MSAYQFFAGAYHGAPGEIKGIGRIRSAVEDFVASVRLGLSPARRFRTAIIGP
jgi:hypothetical protein